MRRSQLGSPFGGCMIAAGVDVVTVSKRLGHSSPTVTLAVYSHLFASNDSKAAKAINEALGSIR